MNNSYVGIYRVVMQFTSIATLVTTPLQIPICIGGILVGDKLLYYFYGAEFSQGYFVLVVMLIVQIINIFHLFFPTYLVPWICKKCIQSNVHSSDSEHCVECSL
jgi:hypothetical protein